MPFLKSMLFHKLPIQLFSFVNCYRLNIERNVSETKNLKSESARIKEELKKANLRRQEERKLLYDIRVV